MANITLSVQLSYYEAVLHSNPITKGLKEFEAEMWLLERFRKLINDAVVKAYRHHYRYGIARLFEGRIDI